MSPPRSQQDVIPPETITDPSGITYTLHADNTPAMVALQGETITLLGVTSATMVSVHVGFSEAAAEIYCRNQSDAPSADLLVIRGAMAELGASVVGGQIRENHVGAFCRSMRTAGLTPKPETAVRMYRFLHKVNQASRPGTAPR